MEGGLSRPLLAVAQEGTTKVQVVLKLQRPASNTGHYDLASLVAELLCACIARRLGLTVPDYYVVDISTELAEAQPEPRVRELLRSNIGENFATRYLEGAALYEPSARVDAQLRKTLETLLAYDAAVFNGDRQQEKPNLLKHEDELVLIDHSLALPVYLWHAAALESPPPFPEPSLRAHCAFPALCGKQHHYSELYARWKSLAPSEWEAIWTLIPRSWVDNRSNPISRFLSERPQHLDAMTAELRRVLQ
jgi:hypothetical protein